MCITHRPYGILFWTRPSTNEIALPASIRILWKSASLFWDVNTHTHSHGLSRLVREQRESCSLRSWQSVRADLQNNFPRTPLRNLDSPDCFHLYSPLLDCPGLLSQVGVFPLSMHGERCVDIVYIWKCLHSE